MLLRTVLTLFPLTNSIWLKIYIVDCQNYILSPSTFIVWNMNRHSTLLKLIQSFNINFIYRMYILGYDYIDTLSSILLPYNTIRLSRGHPSCLLQNKGKCIFLIAQNALLWLIVMDSLTYPLAPVTSTQSTKWL